MQTGHHQTVGQSIKYTYKEKQQFNLNIVTIITLSAGFWTMVGIVVFGETSHSIQKDY